MKRYTPIVAHTPVGAMPMVSEIAGGKYVAHDDVQDMAYQIAECLLYTGSDECIHAVLNRAGFKTKLSFKNNVVPSNVHSDELLPIASPGKKVCPACHTEHWGAMNLCDACDRVTREAAGND